MSDLSHIARPYAKAVFDLAHDAKDYATWSDQLALLSSVVADPALIEVIQNPAVSAQQLSDLMLDVCKGKLNTEGENLVKLLVQNDRLGALSDVTEQFLEMRDEAQQVIEAQLVTASKVDEAQMKIFEQALSKRLGKQIKLEASVDEDLIGGAVVRAGDWVVDGSVKAQLQNLVGAISS